MNITTYTQRFFRCPACQVERSFEMVRTVHALTSRSEQCVVVCEHCGAEHAVTAIWNNGMNMDPRPARKP